MTSLEQFLWAMGTGLKLLLCAAVFYRRLHRRLPIFASYSVLLVGEVVFVWAAYRIYGYTSAMAWYAFWAASGLVLCARGAVIAELCWTVFKAYPGLWALARRTLLLSGGALLGIASVSAALNRYWIVGLVETTQRGLEFAASVILVMTLAFSVRYKAWMAETERAIILGLAAYSLVEMLNHTLLTFTPAAYLPLWNSVRVMAFNASMALWLYSFRKPLSETHAAPVLLTAKEAAELMTEVLGAMRALNNEMKTLSREVWK